MEYFSPLHHLVFAILFTYFFVLLALQAPIQTPVFITEPMIGDPSMLCVLDTAELRVHKVQNFQWSLKGINFD